IAKLRWGQGDVALTKKMSEEALAIFRDIGNRKGSASTITHLGGVAWREGKLDEAQRLWEDALAIYRELGDRSSVARVLNNLAVVMEEGGDLPGALKR